MIDLYNSGFPFDNNNNYIMLDSVNIDSISSSRYPLTGFEFLKKSKTVMRIAVKN